MLTFVGHLLDDLVSKTRPHAGITLEIVAILFGNLFLIENHLGQLLQREEFDGVAQIRFGQLVAVGERAHRIEEAWQQTVLAHGLEDHVRNELALFMVD